MASNFQEMDSFIAKFKLLSSAGCKASLNFTAECGRIGVTLSADLGYCLPPQTSFSPPRPKRGPAYIRRQHRRKEAMEATEKCSSHDTSNGVKDDEMMVVVNESNVSETNAVEVSDLADVVESQPLESNLVSDLKPAPEDDWISTRIKSYAAEFVHPEYLYPSYEPDCCHHNHVPGRRGHNVPKDGSQCCYHKCKKYPHYLSTKPK